MEQIIAMCAEQLNGETERLEEIVVELLTGIRAHRRIPVGTPIVTIIEGCSSDPMVIRPMFVKTAESLGLPLIVMSEVRSHGSIMTEGVPKTSMTTAAMTVVMQGILSRKMLMIPADCIAVSSRRTLQRATLDSLSKKLFEQFAAFRVVSGKITGKGSRDNDNDDVVVALCTAVYWSQIFCSSDRYRNWRDQFVDKYEVWNEGAASFILNEQLRQKIEAVQRFEPKSLKI